MQKNRRDKHGHAVEPQIPVGDCKERWNSKYTMLERLLQLKPYLIQYAADHDIPQLTAAEWALVKKVLRVLGPFFMVTKAVSSNFCLISGNY